jgi:hypothetical protein
LGGEEQVIIELVALAELLELVEQLPELPLALEEDVAIWAVEELPLQLNAFATFVVIVGARIIAKTLVIEMAIAINSVTLFILVIALSDV